MALTQRKRGGRGPSGLSPCVSAANDNAADRSAAAPARPAADAEDARSAARQRTVVNAVAASLRRLSISGLPARIEADLGEGRLWLSAEPDSLAVTVILA